MCQSFSFNFNFKEAKKNNLLYNSLNFDDLNKNIKIKIEPLIIFNKTYCYVMQIHIFFNLNNI
jgi:hypothetical protein